ncbi:MAG: GrpB family protein [Tannerella sp.]|jgi:GrpB-like predicted nucleotidyltransferase (UPF0157 family)|nr:GrpB family protein [Tannerella sp.]
MKIKFEKYNPLWRLSFVQIEDELTGIIGFVRPVIEHIGSTSVEGLSAKPIIDILVGLDSENDLDKIPQPLMNRGYIYYEKYNEVMPYRRFFVKHKVDLREFLLPVLIGKDDHIPSDSLEHNYRLAHIHALLYDSEHWIRHIAFRDYLRTHPDARNAYQELKEQLSTREWRDSNEYNEEKDDFIKQKEKDAIEWYHAMRKTRS